MELELEFSSEFLVVLIIKIPVIIPAINITTAINNNTSLYLVELEISFTLEDIVLGVILSISS